ncbi:hypothetical protein BH09BAC5_BH09BAC5_06970 [soil metagenome]
MKKQLLALSMGLLSAFALSAQVNYSIVDSVSNNLTGTTVSYTIPANALDTRVYTITNTGSSTVNIKVKKTVFALNDPGSTVYFCTGSNCYSPSQTLSLVVTLNPSATVALTCDHFPNNMPGITEVRYTIINQSDPNDSAYFAIEYTSVMTGIATHSFVKPNISNPSPNPASSSFSMNYKMGSSNAQGAKLVVFNMLGDRVMETKIEETDGIIRMDVSTLEQGVYFCSLESDGKMFGTKRLIVAH